MIRVLCFFAALLFAFPALAGSPFVGKWKLNPKPTVQAKLAALKKSPIRKKKPKLYAALVRINKAALKTKAFFRLTKKGKATYKLALKARGKVFKKNMKGTWKRNKKGIVITMAGRYPRIYRCKINKKRLICVKKRGKRSETTYYNRVK